MPAEPDWRPTAGLPALRARAAMLAHIREFFRRRDVLEVETPLLCRGTVTDPGLDAIACGDHWLQTSPEYAMKRLLAAGSGPIFQICKAFRAAESGAAHNPEFSLLEWYRPGFTLRELMDETAALAGECITALRRAEASKDDAASPVGGEFPPASGASPASETASNSGTMPSVSGTIGEDACNFSRPREASQSGAIPSFSGTISEDACTFLDYRELFLEHAGVDPFAADTAALERAARAALDCSSGPADRDGWLDLLFSHQVQPRLPAGFAFVSGYPASQAALARIDASGEWPVAERFELFHAGVELANGYRELLDPDELAARFQADLQRRARLGKPRPPPDARLLAAMRRGLPEMSGVALGLDRLLMQATAAPRIGDVLSFAWERA